MKNKISSLPTAVLATVALLAIAAVVACLVMTLGATRALGVVFFGILVVVAWLVVYTLIELYRDGR